MSKKGLLKATLAFHGILALVVAADAKRSDRCVGKWATVTLFTGLLGVVVYILSGGCEEPPLDELVDQVELD
jgi:hypothetical protein